MSHLKVAQEALVFLRSLGCWCCFCKSCLLCLVCAVLGLLDGYCSLALLFWQGVVDHDELVLDDLVFLMDFGFALAFILVSWIVLLLRFSLLPLRKAENTA